MKKQMIRFAAFVIALFVIGLLQVSAQENDSVGVKGGGVFAKGWTGKIDANGKFAFESLPPGQYVLMVFSKGELKATRTISVQAFANQITVK